MRRPTYSDDTIDEIPAMWYDGTLTSAASSGSAEANSSVDITYDVMCRWRSSAAFGSPVVPDVNNVTATDSVSMPRSEADRPSGSLGAAAAIDTTSAVAIVV